VASPRELLLGVLFEGLYSFNTFGLFGW